MCQPDGEANCPPMRAGEPSDEDGGRTDREPGTQARAYGPFALVGPLDRTSYEGLPVRGDLAHIMLAGRFFVPHYAVPQPRAVMPGGATLHASPDARSPALCDLIEGQSFELLEISGEWAWGCLSADGPTGYVPASRLEALP